MGFLGGLLKVAVKTVALPVAVVKDAVTLGGVLTDEDIPYTAQAVEEIVEDANETIDSLAEGDLL